MRRRAFIRLLGGAAAAWPLAARAQQSKMSVIGYLGPGSAAASASTLAVFRQSLAGAGYVEGRNIAIEYRFAEGRYDRSASKWPKVSQRNLSTWIFGTTTGHRDRRHQPDRGARGQGGNRDDPDCLHRQ
jgi:hypothetical protein